MHPLLTFGGGIPGASFQKPIEPGSRTQVTCLRPETPCGLRSFDPSAP